MLCFLFIPLKAFFNSYLFTEAEGICATACMGVESQDNLGESGLAFCVVGSREQTQLIKFASDLTVFFPYSPGSYAGNVPPMVCFPR